MTQSVAELDWLMRRNLECLVLHFQAELAELNQGNFKQFTKGTNTKQRQKLRKYGLITYQVIKGRRSTVITPFGRHCIVTGVGVIPQSSE